MLMYFEECSDESEDDLYAGRDEESIERLEEEISQLNDTIDGIEAYHIVDKLGEGTFSSVYKAIARACETPRTCLPAQRTS